MPGLLSPSEKYLTSIFHSVVSVLKVETHSISSARNSDAGLNANVSISNSISLLFSFTALTNLKWELPTIGIWNFGRHVNVVRWQQSALATVISRNHRDI